MRRDLKHAVRRRIDNGTPGADVLLPELLDDGGSRRGSVPENRPSDLLLERLDDLRGKSAGIGRERLRERTAHELPVPRRRVLARRDLRETPPRRSGAFGRRDPLDGNDIPEPELPERREVQSAARARGMRERVRTLVAVARRVGEGANADAVDHYGHGPPLQTISH